eukprot:3634923-Prorocentrum_lima.AAC.1
MTTPKEKTGENQGGPWEEPLAASGARHHPTHLTSQEASRAHHSISKWVKCGMLMMARIPKGRG